MDYLLDYSLPIMLDRERVLKSEMDRLWAHYDLLEGKKDSRRFALFLQAEYLNKDQRFHVVHRKLYPKSRNPEASKSYQALLLFDYLGLKGTEQQNLKDAGNFLKKLANKICDFKMHESLKERHATREMITAEAIKGKGKKKIYREVLERWAKAIGKMKLGTWRLYQTWRQADAIHFDPDRVRQKAKDGNLPETRTAFDTYARFYRAFYASEAKGREAMYKAERAEAERVKPAILLENELLAQIYEKILLLREADSSLSDLYEEVKETFIGRTDQLDDYHKYTIFLHFKNYLTFVRRIDPKGTKKESLFWLRFMMEQKILFSEKTVNSIFFTNRVSEAFISRDFDLAEEIQQSFLPFLPEEEAPAVGLLAWAQTLFFKDNFAQVIKLIEEKKAEVEIKGYANLIWYRSIQIRSALVEILHGNDEFDLFLREIANYRRLVKNNTRDFQDDRSEGHLIFLSFCSRINVLAKKNLLSEKCYTLQKEILAAPRLNARTWLYVLISHFDPSLPSRPTPLKPTGNENEPWASLKKHLP